ncbi:hypothetical protein Tco_1333749 [Tanacetum coccineum]
MEARESNWLIQMVDDSHCTLDIKSPERVMDESKMEYSCCMLGLKELKVECQNNDFVTSGIRASRFKAMPKETKKNGASGSTVVDENQGQDDARQNTKKRDMSKDVVASLDKRVVGSETFMAELKTQVEGLEGLEFDFTSIRDDIRVAFNTLSVDLMCEIYDARDMFIDEIIKIRTEFGEEVSTLYQTIKDWQADVALCKRSLASGGGNTINHGLKFDVPKPSLFVGKREAKAVYDFLR